MKANPRDRFDGHSQEAAAGDIEQVTGGHDVTLGPG